MLAFDLDREIAGGKAAMLRPRLPSGLAIFAVDIQIEKVTAMSVVTRPRATIMISALFD